LKIAGKNVSTFRNVRLRVNDEVNWVKIGCMMAGL